MKSSTTYDLPGFDVIGKITRIFKREDGSEVRLVIEQGGRYAHRRESSDHDWQLLSDRPHPDWRSMSVAEYCKRGRAEIYQYLSHGEILKLASYIGKPLSSLEAMA